jgi:hypothetical protein
VPLTRDFEQTIQARASRNAAFGASLLAEGRETPLPGDIDTGKSILRDYINARVGFEKLAGTAGTPPKSLIRMFGRAVIQARTISRRSSSARSAIQGLVCRSDPKPVGRVGGSRDAGSDGKAYSARSIVLDLFPRRGYDRAR